MPHLALYRKYRPQTFSDVVGQDHVTQTLARAVAEDRVAHALLFAGPRGTGKTSSARILAKALNCVSRRKGVEGEPCGECESCLAITEGSSLDVIEYDAASHGSVDDAREIREKVAYAAVASRWKVYIIDECHMLSPAANNALLKVLEEPPEHVVFVFATTEPHKVLQTLIDRCQRYEFRALTAQDLATRVESVADAEALAVDDEAISLIAARASGSARDALSILDQLRAFAGDKVSSDDVRGLLGSLPDDLFFEAVDLIADRDSGGAFAYADRLIRDGVDLREFMRAFVEHLRSLFVIQHANAPGEILETTDDRLERLTSQANRLDKAELLRVIDLANEASVQMRQAIEGRLAVEIALARMTRPELHASGASLLARVERLEGGYSAPEPQANPSQTSVPSPPPTRSETPQGMRRGQKSLAAATTTKKPQPTRERVVTKDSTPKPSVPGEVDLERIQRAWPVILDKVKHRKISFHALLHEAVPAGWKDGELLLEFSPRARFHRDNVGDAQKNTPLVESIEDVLGVRARIRAVVSDEPAPTLTQAETESPGPSGVPDEAEPGDDVKPKDAIDLIRETFGAEVVEE